jgi:hypothetical protein
MERPVTTPFSIRYELCLWAMLAEGPLAHRPYGEEITQNELQNTHPAPKNTLMRYQAARRTHSVKWPRIDPFRPIFHISLWGGQPQFWPWVTIVCIWCWRVAGKVFASNAILCSLGNIRPLFALGKCFCCAQMSNLPLSAYIEKFQMPWLESPGLWGWVGRKTYQFHQWGPASSY